MYQEEDDSTVTHNGKEYSVNDLLRRAAKLPEVDVPPMWVEWCASPDKQKLTGSEPHMQTLPRPYCSQLILNTAMWSWMVHTAYRVLFS